MKHSTDRILTTHVGSLARPEDLLDLMKKKLNGAPIDITAYEAKIRQAVEYSIRKQAECGIDIITDGEMSKSGHAVYIAERLEGFEGRPGQGAELYPVERAAFPEYYEEYFRQAMLGGAIAPPEPMYCIAPVRYCGQEALKADLKNLKEAAAKVPHVEAFVPSVSPTGVGYNDYYRTEEEYLFAVAEAIAEEYRAIIEAGFLLQVDDPFLPNIFMDRELDEKQKDKRAHMYVEAINHSLQGIPEESVRFHTCYGINEGPRVHEPDLGDLIDYVLRVKAGAYSFEAATPRHEHEYHLWEDTKLPEGKHLLPGVITHATNVVEHPQYIAERIVRYAERVGRENVIASADCGFSSQATYKTEVDPRVVWAKFSALSEGARLATRHLWKKSA